MVKMKLCNVKETAERWACSDRLVRRLCAEGRVQGAAYQDGAWQVPHNALKPARKLVKNRAVNMPELTRFAKRIVYQRKKNNHYGLYEYIQVNLTYSSNRMASNRLTRNEVTEVYRTNKITTSFEPVKVDDIIEIINHFAAVVM